jgi:O-antigen/teichoic acid export membrane protein
MMRSAVQRGTTFVSRVRSTGLAGDTAWGLIIEASQLISSLATFAMLGKALDVDGYGDYASLYATILPLATLAAAGVTLAMIQHCLREQEDLRASLRSFLSITVGSGFILTLVGVLLASRVVPALSIAAIASIAVVEFITAPIGQLAAAAVLVKTSYKNAAKIRLIPIVARLIVVIGLYASGHLTVAKLGISFLLVSMVLSFGALIIVSRRLSLSGMPGRVPLRHLRTSVTYSIGIMGLSYQNDGDKSVLAVAQTSAVTGWYAAAYRIVGFGLLPVGTLTAVTQRRFLEQSDGKPGQQLKQSIRFAMVVAIYGLVFGAIVLAISPLLPIVLGEGFRESVPMVRWLVPLVVLRGLATFPMNGLMGLGKTFQRTVLLVVSAVVSMGLYIVLIPRYSWRGAAVGTVISETLLAIGAWTLLVIYQRRKDLEAVTELVRRAGVRRSAAHPAVSSRSERDARLAAAQALAKPARERELRRSAQPVATSDVLGERPVFQQSGPVLEEQWRDPSATVPTGG